MIEATERQAAPELAAPPSPLLEVVWKATESAGKYEAASTAGETIPEGPSARQAFIEDALLENATEQLTDTKLLRVMRPRVAT